MVINKKKLVNLFYIFLTTHLIIWTAIPAFTNNNLPLDTIEALAWGSNLDWGFNKHPPMSAFLVEIFYQMFGAQDWVYYLLSQICVIVSFFVVFKLAEDFFENKIFCLLSVLLLEGIYFYNFTTPEFNVNVCLMPFWTLTVLFLWRGVTENKFSDWFWFGFFSALGFLSKYLFIYLGLAIDIYLIYLIYTKRIDFKCLFSLVPFLFIIFNHLVWLSENDYITITYGLHRTGAEDPNILNHIKHPLIFLGKQIGILIPLFLMLLFLKPKFKIKSIWKDDGLLFLLAINILPIALMFLTSAVMGVKIRTMWMTPFYLFFGVLIIYISQSKINLKKLKGFATIFIILFIFSPFAYAYVSITKTDKRTDYPGKEEARKAYKFYFNHSLHKKYDSVIYEIQGDEWIAGNILYNYDVFQFPGSEWKFKRNKLKWKYSEKLSMCGIFFEKGKEFTDTFSAFDEPKVESFTRCININD